MGLAVALAKGLVPALSRLVLVIIEAPESLPPAIGAGESKVRSIPNGLVRMGVEVAEEEVFSLMVAEGESNWVSTEPMLMAVIEL